MLHLPFHHIRRIRIASQILGIASIGALFGASTASAESDAYCGTYAQTAVIQYTENLNLACGFTGPRWLGEQTAHFIFCKVAARPFLDAETASRAAQLAECSGGAAPPADPVVPEPVGTPETDCFNFVQGNIPWNQGGASTWAPNNIQNLCQGTTMAAEPGRCFDRLMSGGVSWGGGTVWTWQNALSLCKGTSNANATVACFQGQIGGGATWQQGIAACGPASGPSSAEDACFDFVQGNIPWSQGGSSTWAPANVEALCQGTTSAAEPGRCFDRLMSGGVSWGGGTVWTWQNALNLCEGTNNANATVACFQGKIGGGVAWQQATTQCK